NPGAVTKRSVVVKAKETASPDALLGDVTFEGADLTVVLSGGTPNEQTWPLPIGSSAISGKPFWSGDAVKGFKYKDTKLENGPVKSAAIKKTKKGLFTIKVAVSGKTGGITLVPPNPGTGGCARLRFGADGDVYHMRFGSDGKLTTNGSLLFKVAKPTVQG